MTALIVFGVIFIIVWTCVQANTEKNRAKWKRRFEPWRPIVRHVRGDVRATYNTLAVPFRLRRHRSDWDDDFLAG